VIVAGSADDDALREVVEAGGAGYLLKTGPARHLIDAISYVRDGGQYFSPQLERRGLVPAASGHWREQIRQAGSDLDAHDYEIMSRMADGIRPILDRLDEIDDRIALMEKGRAPVPAQPRDWLNRELAETLGNDARAAARIPDLIDDAVTRRFNQMAGRLQREIEETHIRTLESFVHNIQVKLVRRVSALEQDMSRQAESMQELRDSSQRTEDNLSRLIAGVDELVREMPRRLQSAPAEESSVVQPEHREAVPAARARRDRRKPRWPMAVWALVGGLAFSSLIGWGIRRYRALQSSGASTALASPSPLPASPLPPGADAETRMKAARQYADRKDYKMAEIIYKEVLDSDPNNVEVLQALAKAQYNQSKFGEAAATLDRIPH
jgi:hypothetical protein